MLFVLFGFTRTSQGADLEGLKLPTGDKDVQAVILDFWIRDGPDGIGPDEVLGGLDQGKTLLRRCQSVKGFNPDQKRILDGGHLKMNQRKTDQ